MGDSKVDLILNNFYSKTLHLLLESRVALPETKTRVSKWFNIQTTDSGSSLFHNELSTWKNLSNTTQIPPMVVEFILDSSDIPPNQACLFVDNQNKRNTVQESVVLERWTLQLTGSGSASGTQEELPVVYKRSIVLFRALYTLLRLLPLYGLIRRLRRCHSRGLNIGCRLSAEKGASEGVLPIDAQLSQDTASNATDIHRFSPINTPVGTFNLSVDYRRSINFIVDDIESLLSSHFVDEDYYTPTLTKHRSTSGEKVDKAEKGEEGNVVRDYVARTGASRVRTSSNLSNLSPRTTSYSSSPSVRPLSMYGASPSPSFTGVGAHSYQRMNTANTTNTTNTAISIPENQSSSSSTTNRRYSSSFGYRRTSSIGGSSGESVIKPLASPTQPTHPSPPVGVSRKISTKLSSSLAEEDIGVDIDDDNDIGEFIKMIDEKPQLKSRTAQSVNTITKQELNEKIKMMSVSSLANKEVQDAKEEERQDFGEVVGQMDFDELDVRRSMSAPISTTSSRAQTGVNAVNAALTAATSPDDKAPLFYDVGASRGRSSSRQR